MRVKKHMTRLLRENILLLFVLVLCLCVGIVKPIFFSVQNLTNILIQISIPALVATGMTFVIILGGIDLAVGSVAAFSGIVTTALLTERFGLGLASTLLASIGICLLIALVFGSFVGCAVAYLRIEAFIATLAMTSIARGFAFVYTRSKPIYNLPESYGWLGTGRIGPVPIMVILMVVVFVVAHIVLNRTVFGRNVYAVGSNEQVALLSGIHVRKVKIIVFMLSTFLAALAGICLSSRLMMGQPGAADGYELDAIASVAMGGTSMSGGSGGVTRTIKGVVIIGVIHNGLSLLQVDSYWQTIATGFIIFLAVASEKINSLRAG